jgi:hypothetical protein
MPQEALLFDLFLRETGPARIALAVGRVVAPTGKFFRWWRHQFSDLRSPDVNKVSLSLGQIGRSHLKNLAFSLELPANFPAFSG